MLKKIYFVLITIVVFSAESQSLFQKYTEKQDKLYELVLEIEDGAININDLYDDEGWLINGSSLVSGEADSGFLKPMLVTEQKIMNYKCDSSGLINSIKINQGKIKTSNKEITPVIIKKEDNQIIYSSQNVSYLSDGSFVVVYDLTETIDYYYNRGEIRNNSSNGSYEAFGTKIHNRNMLIMHLDAELSLSNNIEIENLLEVLDIFIKRLLERYIPNHLNKSRGSDILDYFPSRRKLFNDLFRTYFSEFLVKNNSELSTYRMMPNKLYFDVFKCSEDSDFNDNSHLIFK